MNPISVFLKSVLLTTLVLYTTGAVAQETKRLKREGNLDLAFTTGQFQSVTALSYVHNWYLGKKKRFVLGAGLRATLASGRNQQFTTAGPARLTRSYTTPFLIFFAGQKTENWDTLTVSRPGILAQNIMINLGYRFTPKLSAGFNIDVFGVVSSFKHSRSQLQTNGVVLDKVGEDVDLYNLLLTGDHDRGTLNSEFYVTYRINRRFAARAIYQFLFTEYKTTNVHQVASDGTIVNRFRNKSNNFGAGLSFYF